MPGPRPSRGLVNEAPWVLRDFRVALIATRSRLQEPRCRRWLIQLSRIAGSFARDSIMANISKLLVPPATMRATALRPLTSFFPPGKPASPAIARRAASRTVAPPVMAITHRGENNPCLRQHGEEATS